MCSAGFEVHSTTSYNTDFSSKMLIMHTNPPTLTEHKRASEIKPQSILEALTQDVFDQSISSPYNAVAVDQLEVAVAAHMLKLREQGRLSPIEVDKRRGLWWFESWNEFVAGHDVRLYDLIIPIAKEVRYHAMGSAEVDKWKVAADLLDGRLGEGGDVLIRVDGECQVTGSRAVLEISPGWQLKLRKFARKEGVRGLVRSDFEPLPPPTMIQVQVDAPSGRILVADWFRFSGNEFSNYCDDGLPNVSINSQYGRILRTQFLAQQKGVLSISVGNTSPSVYQDGDRMILARLDPDAPGERAEGGRTRLADTCTDLWWVTMIDEAVLRQRLGVFLKDQEKADAAVNEYLQSGECEVLEIPPGTLFMSFPSEEDTFRVFDCKDTPLSLKDVKEMYAVLSSEPIEWVEWAGESVEVLRPERQR